MKATEIRYGLLALSLIALMCGVAAYYLSDAADEEVPRVELNADNIGPRSIEDLTSKSVPRDYAFAWQTMEQALDENRPGLLDGYFTGLAKQDLTQRVNSQIKSGLHTRYQDRGHKVEALFYSPAGDAMQLRDRTQLDIQILDRSQVIHDEPVTLEYMVLLTPGPPPSTVRHIQTVARAKP